MFACVYKSNAQHSISFRVAGILTWNKMHLAVTTQVQPKLASLMWRLWTRLVTAQLMRALVQTAHRSLKQREPGIGQFYHATNLDI